MSMIFAHKYNEDYFYSNLVYSQISGLSEKKIFIMEKYIMETINYNFHINGKVYNEYAKDVLSYLK